FDFNSRQLNGLKCEIEISLISENKDAFTVGAFRQDNVLQAITVEVAALHVEGFGIEEDVVALECGGPRCTDVFKEGDHIGVVAGRSNVRFPIAVEITEAQIIEAALRLKVSLRRKSGCTDTMFTPVIQKELSRRIARPSADHVRDRNRSEGGARRNIHFKKFIGNRSRF